MFISTSQEKQTENNSKRIHIDTFKNIYIYTITFIKYQQAKNRNSEILAKPELKPIIFAGRIEPSQPHPWVFGRNDFFDFC